MITSCSTTTSKPWDKEPKNQDSGQRPSVQNLAKFFESKTTEEETANFTQNKRISIHERPLTTFRSHPPQTNRFSTVYTTAASPSSGGGQYNSSINGNRFIINASSSFSSAINNTTTITTNTTTSNCLNAAASPTCSTFRKSTIPSSITAHSSFHIINSNFPKLLKNDSTRRSKHETGTLQNPVFNQSSSSSSFHPNPSLSIRNPFLGSDEENEDEDEKDDGDNNTKIKRDIKTNSTKILSSGLDASMDHREVPVMSRLKDRIDSLSKSGLFHSSYAHSSTLIPSGSTPMAFEISPAAECVVSCASPQNEDADVNKISFDSTNSKDRELKDKQMKQRNNIMKELVDTETAYRKDLIVLRDVSEKMH